MKTHYSQPWIARAKLILYASGESVETLSHSRKPHLDFHAAPPRLSRLLCAFHSSLEVINDKSTFAHFSQLSAFWEAGTRWATNVGDFGLGGRVCRGNAGVCLCINGNQSVQCWGCVAESPRKAWSLKPRGQGSRVLNGWLTCVGIVSHPP